MNKLGSLNDGNVWKLAEEKYEIQGFINSGSFGEVAKARVRNTDEIVAIKLIKNIFDDLYNCKKVFREIAILRKLSKMP